MVSLSRREAGSIHAAEMEKGLVMEKGRDGKGDASNKVDNARSAEDVRRESGLRHIKRHARVVNDPSSEITSAAGDLVECDSREPGMCVTQATAGTSKPHRMRVIYDKSISYRPSESKHPLADHAVVPVVARPAGKAGVANDSPKRRIRRG
jgi:hypothetical protein